MVNGLSCFLSPLINVCFVNFDKLTPKLVQTKNNPINKFNILCFFNINNTFLRQNQEKSYYSSKVYISSSLVNINIYSYENSLKRRSVFAFN